MIIRAVKKNNALQNEFCFGHGLSDYKKQNYEVIQDIETALLEFKNDCFFAMDNGIDWRTRLGYHNQKDLLDDDIIKLVEARYGVLSVQDYQSSVFDRSFTCQFSVYTIFSEEAQIIEFSKEA